MVKIILSEYPKKLDYPAGRLSFFFNHYLVEPFIWAIGAYGIGVGLFATFAFGFFTLKEYSLASILYIFPNAQNIALWYDAYPYSLLVFGSYILFLYYKFKPQSYLALPVFLVTYATWDFLGIGNNIFKGYSIIWFVIAILGLSYFIPLYIKKRFTIRVSFIGLILFFALGVLFLQNTLLSTLSYSGNINGMLNEATFCLLCYLSISVRNHVNNTNP